MISFRKYIVNENQDKNLEKKYSPTYFGFKVHIKQRYWLGSIKVKIFQIDSGFYDQKSW